MGGWGSSTAGGDGDGVDGVVVGVAGIDVQSIGMDGDDEGVAGGFGVLEVPGFFHRVDGAGADAPAAVADVDNAAVLVLAIAVDGYCPLVRVVVIFEDEADSMSFEERHPVFANGGTD